MPARNAVDTTHGHNPWMPSSTDSPSSRFDIHKQIWSIALPAMLANLATALFSVADLWVIGRLGDAAAQGAVELGAKLLMGMLTVFLFLRTGTVALTAQAIGRDQAHEQGIVLLRAMALALALGVVLLLLKPWIISGSLRLFAAGQAVGGNATLYLDIRYWSIPAWLMSAALTGWLIGHQRLLPILVIEVSANIAHILLDLLFVLVLHQGVAGVATATLLSEWGKLLALAGVAASRRAHFPALALLRHAHTWRVSALLQLLRINRDLFIRSLLLTAGILLLTRGGAQAGPDTLAANGIIFQLFMVATLILDGFESPAQVLGGQAVGAGRRAWFKRLGFALQGWGLLTSIVIALIFLLSGQHLAASFSTSPEVIALTGAYTGWLVVLPLLGVTSFVLDGIFIGATWTRAMLLTVAIGFAGYLAALYLLQPWGNHGLWAAYALMLALRAGGQTLLLPGLMRKTFRAKAPTVVHEVGVVPAADTKL